MQCEHDKEISTCFKKYIFKYINMILLFFMFVLLIFFKLIQLQKWPSFLWFDKKCSCNSVSQYGYHFATALEIHILFNFANKYVWSSIMSMINCIHVRLRMILHERNCVLVEYIIKIPFVYEAYSKLIPITLIC